MVFVLGAIAMLAVRQHAPGPNLLTNPGFSRGWEGWSPIWARETSAAKAELETGRVATNRAVVVVSTGAKDWALAQERSIDVHAGDVYEISAWMKSEAGAGTISTVARDAAGTTLQWDLGAKGPSGLPGTWQRVHRLLVVPAGCTTLQFRVVGTGPGRTSVEAPSLIREDMNRGRNVPPVTIRGANLSLRIDADGALLATPNRGKPWRYRAWSGDYVMKSLVESSPKSAQIEALDLANDLPVKLDVKVDATRPEATIALEASGAMEREVALPGNVVTEPGQWVILPMNEGIRLPVEDKVLDGWSLVTYGGHGLCMPWSGVVEPKSGAGAMTILETPDDADMQLSRVDDALTFAPRWEPSRQAFGYRRTLRMCYFDRGGFVAMAKRYRAFAKTKGLFKTLAAKRAENSNVDRLVGAVNIWNWDMDKVALCREMRQMGFERVLWSSGGTAEQVREIASLGYLPGRYDIYQDVWDPGNSLKWQNTEGWPEDLVLLPDGDWMKGWAHPDRQPDGSIKWYQGGVICSAPGLAIAKRKIPADLAQVPYLARFLDTTTASPFRECFNPAHPLTRTQDKANKMALLAFCANDMKQVLGSETGIDPSVPYSDYYEGMMSLGPFRLPDAGTFMMEYRKPTPEFLKYQVGPVYRIPLWELVYHDCTVAQWYWGDASNKAPEVWDLRDLLNMLYGTAPLLMFDRPRWEKDKARMLQTYRNVCEWTRKIGYDEMLSHEDLTQDHTVQKTAWSSGRTVTVNFGDRSFGGLAPKSFAFGTINANFRSSRLN